MLPYTAYLRVYQPLDAFSSTERAYWSAYAHSPERPRRVHAVAAEHAESLRRLVADPPVVAPLEESRHAYVRRSGSEVYVCPWQTRLRSWLAFDEFRRRIPPRMSPVYVPERVAAAVEEEFRDWRERRGPARPQTLTRNWQIPFAWFTPFGRRERCLVVSARGEGGPRSEFAPAPADDTGTDPEDPRTARLFGAAAPAEQPYEGPPASRVLLYVTDLAQARRRMEHAAGVLREHGDAVGLLPGIALLEDWISAVAHPRSLLELDYGGLVHLFGDKELADDHSVGEVEAAVTGLATRRSELAVAMFGRLDQRWRSARALERAN